MYCRYFDTTRKGNHSSVLIPTVVGGQRPLLSEICAQIDSPIGKTPTSTDFYFNVSTVRDSERSSIMTNRKSTTGFPTSYRRSTYVTPKSPKGWLKSDLFLIKLNFRRIKSATKFLCVKTSSGIVVELVVQPFPYLMVHLCWHET